MLQSGDPIAKARARLIERDGEDPGSLDEVVVTATTEMAELLAVVRAGAEPDVTRVFDDVFAGSLP